MPSLHIHVNSSKVMSPILPFAGPVFRMVFREPLHTT
ncbi:hypothetical protein EV562_10139 [Streptomyces sp. BK208]|nr:hypothetical protein EV562_10139 [Streptomyces sp. BK208]